ncbi:hypothetical protein HPB50_025250 [Hyalomma asiaticum]|uniref:Uncharacterized protein n=1 Tax=Hyalomma asiaticum TaxID=266040 RepID=A0ACB7SHV0_HYAAI|nr:hypothetical protein HPB50_025250 [Hyalomma asiaticum]
MLNRKLELISKLNKAIEDHSRNLCTQQWDEVRDSIEGWILDEVGLAPTDNLACNTQLPRKIRQKLVITPLPRNVHPVHNAGRRKARASAILKQIHNDKDEASFVDAAAYRDGKAFAVSVVDALGSQLCLGSDDGSRSGPASGHSTRHTRRSKRQGVYSDSKAAVKAFQICRVAHKYFKF